MRPAIDRLKVDPSAGPTLKSTRNKAYRWQLLGAQCGHRVRPAVHLSHLPSRLRTSGSPSQRSDRQTLECYDTTFLRNAGNRLSSVATSYCKTQLASLHFRLTLPHTATCTSDRALNDSCVLCTCMCGRDVAHNMAADSRYPHDVTTLTFATVHTLNLKSPRPNSSAICV